MCILRLCRNGEQERQLAATSRECRVRREEENRALVDANRVRATRIGEKGRAGGALS